MVAARDVQVGEPVAIKFLHPRLAMDITSVERFVREAKAASRISSEHVIRVKEVGATETGLPFIAMELLQGQDLASFVAGGTAQLTLAADCVIQAAAALAEAHAAGIVHRDIKPSNLWLSRGPDGNPFVKVLDFGISKLESVEGDSKLTDTRAVFGSPAYMSPEQIRSAKRVDHRTDVWALGVVLYELLAGRVPFEADNVAGVLAAITADPPAQLARVRPDLPLAVEEVVLACLVKDPGRRASLGDLAAALAPFASSAGQRSAARVVELVPPTQTFGLAPTSSRSLPSFAITDTRPDLPPPPRNRRALLASIGSVLVAGVVVAVFWAWPTSSPRSASTAASVSSSLPPPAASSASMPAAPAPNTEAPLASAPTPTPPKKTPPTTLSKKTPPRPTSPISEDRQ